MSLGQKVDGMIDNYLGTKDELAVIQPIVAPPPPRFNPVSFSVPGKAPPPATFMNAWKQMDLSHLWAYPIFEEGVFALLEANYGELNSIFSQYAKSGTAGSASMSALMTMQQTEFMSFCLDCGVQTPEFNAARIGGVFTRADQVDDTLKATKVKTVGIDVHAETKGSSIDKNDQSVGDHRIAEIEVTVMKGEDAKPGDHGLTFPEFLEALVAISLFRANPKLGELGHDECDDPLPGCLEKLLTANILANAKRDALALVRSSIETDSDVLAMLPEIRKKLQTKSENKVARSYEEVTKVGVRKVFGQPVMSMDMLQDELTARRVFGDLTVKPTPKVKGDVFPERHMNLSWLDVKGAFTTCQNGFTGRDTAETSEGNETIDFEEFITLLGLCGHIKYAEIDEMSLADKMVGIVDNWCMLRDEQAVIDDACVPPPPRYDFAALAKPLKGQDAREHDRLVATWSAMDLGHIYGFPVWEEAAFGVIQRAFPELVSIFTEYAKSGSAGSGSAKAAMTMQSTELTNLALDCELQTDNFKMARINAIFMRADQVDDTFVVDKADRRKVKGKGAEAGDKGLELHEFLECLILLSFNRQNPEFGNLGKQADPESPMPGCLELVLEKCILKNARRDKLAKVRKMVDKDPEVALVKKRRYAELRAQFEQVCMRDTTTMQGTKDAFGNKGDAKKPTGVGNSFGDEAEEEGTGSTLGMDVFCDEMSDRNVSEDCKITPTPNITGLFLPSVHCNLSWLDVKGAYVTCQVGTALEDQTIDFDEFLTCLALCGTIKYENVKGIGNQGRPPNMKIGEQDDAGDPTPADGADCPLAVMVDGIYANFLKQKGAHEVITEYQQPKLPRYDWQSSGADKRWMAMYAKMDLSHCFGWPLWEKEVFELLGKHYNELKLIFQQYAKTGSAGSATAEQLFSMQKTELTNLSLDCGISTADFPQARVMNVFERANEVDDSTRTGSAASGAEKKVKSTRAAQATEDRGLELHEFLECLVNMAFQRANPKYGQVGKSDASAGGIDLMLLPECLESLLVSNILVKAKRDQVPAWRDEIARSAECQRAIDERREALRMVWRADAGKGEQGAQMTNKNMTDVGLSMDLATFVDSMNARGLMKDLTIPPQPPVVGMAVEKVHLNLSALDIKAAFVGAQESDVTQGGKSVEARQGGNKRSDALSMGDQNYKVNFDEWLLAIALCGHIKYIEVKGSTMAGRAAGALDNYLGVRSEKAVISQMLYPPAPRTQIAETARPMAGMPKQQHELFIATWKSAMAACLEIDVIGFPLWEEAVFKMLHKVFDELQAIFSNYSQSIAGGSLQATTLQTATMQDNELIAFCRDSGLITEKFSNARVQSLFKDVANAFAATKTTGGTASNGQGGGTGVYSAGIHMPAFVVLLLLIALNRANPKLGQVGEAGEAAVDVPLPGCLEALLQGNILKKAKRNKMSMLKTELMQADYKSLVAPVKGALQKEFEKACKKREKMPAVALFAKYMMSRGTLVAEFKDKGIIVQKAVKGKPKVTGDAAAEVDLMLSALDCESAFTLCQSGAHGDAANDTIEFDEFLLCLCLAGAFKYSSASAGLAIPRRVEAIVQEYTGKSSAEAALASATPALERYDPSGSGADPAFIAEWVRMGVGLENVLGFPLWEEAVFKMLGVAFDDLRALFAYYAGDTPGMQQAELVDLALDNKMATREYPITKLIALFERSNRESGGGDADFELHEFLTFLVHLAFERHGSAEPDALAALLAGLRRSRRIEELKPVLEVVKREGDAGVAGAIAAGELVISAAFAKIGGGKPVGERALLAYLEECKQIRSVIVTLPSGTEGFADLTWQDASGAFHLIGGGGALGKEAFAQCLAVCGVVKYGAVDALGPTQKVEGFLANLTGAKDEQAVVG